MNGIRYTLRRAVGVVKLDRPNGVSGTFTVLPVGKTIDVHGSSRVGGPFLEITSDSESYAVFARDLEERAMDLQRPLVASE
jgi:hypothetical protein